MSGAVSPSQTRTHLCHIQPFSNHTTLSPEKSRKTSSLENMEESQQTRARENYLGPEDYFMAAAVLSAKRSKDPSTQVGACIVNQENKIVGIGYNGMPNRCDGKLPWARNDGNKLDPESKYPYVCHAELNAIMNKNSADVKGCTMYVTLFPCNECAKLIIQAGIKEVVYLSDKYHDTPDVKASKKMLSLAGVQTREFTPKESEIVIPLNK
ncbi:deoxycytidylate deaminase-like [Seriola aureovittata]|uniref:deoxycytidylate deaminase-like n=1 Tax=Seriola aureovittata TaxID=2871759 RepID=UPI0024BE1FB9|nr:deoxycytidylate deaminase-like [Seriola aureovittata]